MEMNTNQTALGQTEQQALREVIKQFADTLQMFDQEKDVASLEEMIATLNGIGQGVIGCAVLLRGVLAQRNQSWSSDQTAPTSHSVQVRREASKALRHCIELSRLLRILRRDMVVLSPSEIGELEDVGRQLQAAIGSITAEWEDFCC